MREGAPGKTGRHWQLWSTGWVGPKQREGGRITGRSTCEKEWKLEEGEAGKKGQEKDAGARDYGY